MSRKPHGCGATAGSVGMLEAAEPLDQSATEALAEHRKDYAIAAGREQLEITFSVYNGDPNGESDLCHLTNFSISFAPGMIEGFIERLRSGLRGELSARQTDPPTRTVRGHRMPAASDNKKRPRAAATASRSKRRTSKARSVAASA